MNINKSEVKYFEKPVEGTRRYDIFSYNNLVLRVISKHEEQVFLNLFSSGLIEELVALRLMPETKISNFVMDEHSLMIEQNQIEWNIQPQEYTFTMLQEVAKCVLNVNKICLKYGYQTSDCHGFNVLFHGSHPQFIDIGSFVEKSISNVWLGIDEFIRCYLYPLKLWSQGQFYLAHRLLSDAHWARFSVQDLSYQEGFEYLLKEDTDFDVLIQYVSTFKNVVFPTLWHDYQEPYYNQDGTIKTVFRFEKILNMIKTMDIQSIHDVAGNQGVFTRYLFENTEIEKYLCSDKDVNAIDSFFKITSENVLLQDKVTCALLNIMSSIQNYGDSAFERLACDAVFALALLHHLVLSDHSPIELILSNLEQYTKKYIFIEFMPYTHLNTHSRIVDESLAYYTEQWFKSAFVKTFDLLKIERLELNRILFVGQKKDLTAQKVIANTRKIHKKTDVPVMIVFQNEQNIAVLDALKYFKGTSFLAVVDDTRISADAIIKLEKWLKKHCETYEINRIPANTADPVCYAIDCFFTQHEHGIIIEDGFIPDESFFRYCTELLHHYQAEEAILQISGVNLLNNGFYSDASYIFTHSFFGGAFATWKEKWTQFKAFNIHAGTQYNLIPEIARLLPYYAIKSAEDWRYKWILFGLYNQYLSIQPHENLVRFMKKENEGLRYFDTISTGEIQFPLKHPNNNQCNEKYDSILNTDFFNPWLPFVQNKVTSSVVAITSEDKVLKLLPKEQKQLIINIRNLGTSVWSSMQPFPVNISYHWINLHEDYSLYDGIRTSLTSCENVDLGGHRVPQYLFLLPDENKNYSMNFLAPEIPGSYKLSITLVQETQFWFDAVSETSVLEIPVEVVMLLDITSMNLKLMEQDSVITQLFEMTGKMQAQIAAMSAQFEREFSTDLLSDPDILDDFYLKFENTFRGSEEDIENRLQIYLPYFQKIPKKLKKMPVLDMGCGRGEMLTVLTKALIKNMGVDLNESMVLRCQEKQLNVVKANVLTYFSEQASDSLAGVVGIHIVEHIAFSPLLRLFKEVYRTLAVGGIVVFETPNPENIQVGSCNFYIDPSHLHPIPPQVLTFMLTYSGFKNVEVLRLHPNKEINLTKLCNESDISDLVYRFYMEQDYAVIGYKISRKYAN